MGLLISQQQNLSLQRTENNLSKLPSFRRAAQLIMIYPYCEFFKEVNFYELQYKNVQDMIEQNTTLQKNTCYIKYTHSTLMIVIYLRRNLG